MRELIFGVLVFFAVSSVSFAQCTAVQPNVVCNSIEELSNLAELSYKNKDDEVTLRFVDGTCKTIMPDIELKRNDDETNTCVVAIFNTVLPCVAFDIDKTTYYGIGPSLWKCK